MKRFQIVKNDSGDYRIKRRIRLGFIKLWIFEKYLEINDTYPKVISHPVEFDSEADAERYIRKRLKSIEAHKTWHVVKSYAG